MHILTRQVNQGIVIGESLQVTVLEIHEDRVRLGFSSPGESPSYWEKTLYLDPWAAPDEDTAEPDAAPQELQLR